MKLIEICEEFQPRVEMGASGQDAVVTYLQDKFGDLLSDYRVAHVGSTVDDVTAMIDGQPIKIEVKNVNNPQIRTTIYEASVSRNSRDRIIDNFIRSATQNKFSSLTEWLDYNRKKDRSVGYPKDPGVKNFSGKLPRGRTTSDPTIVKRIRDRLLTKLRSQHVNYFAIYNSVTNQVNFFYTGEGQNILGVRRLPPPSSIMLDTYGFSKTPGVLRLALKASFRL